MADKKFEFEGKEITLSKEVIEKLMEAMGKVSAKPPTIPKKPVKLRFGGTIPSSYRPSGALVAFFEAFDHRWYKDKRLCVTGLNNTDEHWYDWPRDVKDEAVIIKRFLEDSCVD